MTDAIVITGAAGFIGSQLAERLTTAGHDVVGIDNFDPFYARGEKERNLTALRESRRFRFVEADIARDQLPLEGASVVIHLAARPGVRPSLEDPAGYCEVNVTGTARVFDQARRAGIGRIVFGSSSSVYGISTPAPFAEDAVAATPISPYAATKRAGELLAHAFAHLYGTRIACLRFFTVYGPRQRPDLAIRKMTALVTQGRPVRVFGDGSSERDYTYITDALDGILAAIEWTGRGPAGQGDARAFNIGGGSRVRLDRLLAVLGETLGRKIEIERHPDQPGDVPLTAADLTRSGQELGYRPQVGIEDGLRRFAAWFEEVHGRQR